MIQINCHTNRFQLKEVKQLLWPIIINTKWKWTSFRRHKLKTKRKIKNTEHHTGYLLYIYQLKMNKTPILYPTYVVIVFIWLVRCYCHSDCIITIFERCLISFRVISHLNDLFTMKFNVRSFFFFFVGSEFWLMNQYILSTSIKTVTMLHGDSRGLKTNQLSPGILNAYRK